MALWTPEQLSQGAWLRVKNTISLTISEGATADELF